MVNFNLRRFAGPVPLALLALFFLHSCFLTFPMTAYGQWLFDIIHMPPATTTIYYSMAFIPWNLKPIYGLISDNFPIWGSHRKSYIVLCEIGAALSLFFTGTIVNSISGAFIVKIFDSIFESFAQILLGIFLVDIAAKDPTSKTSAQVQSWSCGAKNTASIIALLLGIPIYKDKSITPQQVIVWTSFLPLIAGVVCIFGVNEVKSNQQRSTSCTMDEELLGQIGGMEEESRMVHFRHDFRRRWQRFKKDMKRKARIMRPVLPTMLFFCLCSAIPSDYTTWYQYTFSLLKDQPECIQFMSISGMCGRLLSCFMYARFCTGRNIRRVFVASTISSVVAGLPRLLLAPPMIGTQELPFSVCSFGAIESFVTAFTGEFALLQLLVVATFYCPSDKNLYGLTYALYLSFMDLGGVLSGLLSAFVVSMLGLKQDPVTFEVDWTNLWILVIISASGQLLVLVFLFVLPKKVEAEVIMSQMAAEDREEQESDQALRSSNFFTTPTGLSHTNSKSRPNTNCTPLSSAIITPQASERDYLLSQVEMQNCTK